MLVTTVRCCSLPKISLDSQQLKKGYIVTQPMCFPVRYTLFYAVSQKQDTILLPIDSPNVNRFSTVFHCQT